MGTSTFYRAGDLFGVRYVFGRGEGLRMHSHARHDMQHNVIVLQGAVTLRGQTLRAGDPPFNIADDQPHEIAALGDGAIILNIYLHGVPDVFQEAQDGEVAGPVEML
ncbi:MAG TPA: hypothetical protein VNZ53_26685 [Steroidobacteraceae bacterium]|jgi:hypothetical protein|nr:hypothetical protein [Steroidobacteraceae bacterium]